MNIMEEYMEFEKIKNMIAEKMDMDPEDITEDTSFEDMQIDSLDLVEIMMDLEDEFDVSIETDEEIKNVGALVDYIKAHAK